MTPNGALWESDIIHCTVNAMTCHLKHLSPLFFYENY